MTNKSVAHLPKLEISWHRLFSNSSLHHVPATKKSSWTSEDLNDVLFWISNIKSHSQIVVVIMDFSWKVLVSNISDLPDELWLRVFSFPSFEKLFAKIHNWLNGLNIMSFLSAILFQLHYSEFKKTILFLRMLKTSWEC